METINTRVSRLIVELGITKTAFANKLKVSQAFVSQICSGDSGISERTLHSICDKFHVNESWLRFGEGEIFEERTREEEIAEFMGELIDGPNNFKKRLVSVLANLDEDGWQLLADMAEQLAREAEEEQKKNPGQD